MAKIIIKNSGEKEPFDSNKFTRSLRNAGASTSVADALAQEVIKNKSLKTTKEIYRFAFKELRKLYKPLAARYSLKKALMKLGPSGFPFEDLIAQLFREQGYTTKTGVEVLGKCTNHEVDVVGAKQYEFIMAEAKYHNNAGQKTDIQDALYVKARFDDIKSYYKKTFPKKTVITMLTTNTQFTAKAQSYSECAELTLLGWGYPKNKGLEVQLEKFGLLPITTLTTLSEKVTRQLIDSGCFLCRDVKKHERMLKRLIKNDKKVQEIIDESLGVCAIP